MTPDEFRASSPSVSARPIMQTAIDIAERVWRRGGKQTVMVAKDPASERGLRSLILHRDAVGLYVRIGRRATTNTYLKDMPSARIVDRELDLVVFHEWSNN